MSSRQAGNGQRCRRVGNTAAIIGWFHEGEKGRACLVTPPALDHPAATALPPADEIAPLDISRNSSAAMSWWV